MANGLVNRGKGLVRAGTKVPAKASRGMARAQVAMARPVGVQPVSRGTTLRPVARPRGR